MIGGLTDADEIRVPDSTSGSTATWRVIRGGRGVAQVTFLHAPGDRGWLAESGDACEGLTINPG